MRVVHKQQSSIQAVYIDCLDVNCVSINVKQSLMRDLILIIPDITTAEAATNCFFIVSVEREVTHMAELILSLPAL